MATDLAVIITQFDISTWDVRGGVCRDISLTSFAGGSQWGSCLQVSVGTSYVPLTRAEVQAVHDVMAAWLNDEPRHEIVKRFGGGG